MTLGTRLKQRAPAWLCALAGGLGAFLLMANEGQVRHGALYGLLCMLLCVGGLLRALGLLRPGDAPSLSLRETSLGLLPGEPRWAAPAVTVPSALLVFVVLALASGADGIERAITLGLLALAPSAWRRPALLVFVGASLLYLPLLGTFGLWDPWETHYGEVSREILARDDFISLWWAQDRWFWSKPIFIFWIEALFWSASGVGYLPDSNFQHSEWVLRMPTYLLSVAALVTVYLASARFFGRRVGLLAALVLATMPYYALLTHQAITDMPFVATMTMAVMLLLLAVQTDPEQRARRYRLGPLHVSAHELVLGAFLLLVLPQVLYLVSRNVTFMDHLFAWHRDEFMAGSGHNPSVPGNDAPRGERPRFRSLALEPMAQALLWASCTVGVVLSVRREQRLRSLMLVGFYLLCALSFMAKGLPGFALPGLLALLYLWSCKRWDLLLRGELRVALGALVLATVSLPWFLAMFVRHGSRFTDRILIHDHINRLTTGVHGDNGSIQYFIQQLGYGTFPWIALAPLALGSFVLLHRADSADAIAASEPSAEGPPAVVAPPALSQGSREALTVIGLWFAVAFTLFSAMTTKFHHYIFPAVPPAAILIGLVLDRMLGTPTDKSARAGVLAMLAPLPLVLGVAGLRGDPRGILPDGLSGAQRAVWALQHPWPTWVCGTLIGTGLVLLALARVLDRGRARESGGTDAALGAGLLAGAALVAFVGRDLSWTTAKRPAGQERLVDLFIYNYDRPFPPHFDYRPIFTGFAIVACTLVVAAAWPRIRSVFTHALVGLSLVFTVFYLNVYMIDLTPHWSQRDLVARYYRLRKSSKEPLVAWQMNWKGENFYSGNRVAVFVNLNNKEVTTFMDKHKGKNAFFLLEHGRIQRFKSLAGERKVSELSTERDNNKFVLVKVAL